MSNKLNMHTKDIVGKNIEAVGALFPHCVTEAIDEYGNVKRLINFEILRGELSEDLASDVRERGISLHGQINLYIVTVQMRPLGKL